MRQKLEKTIVMAVANHKGGSGKTSIAGGIIWALSLLGYKVLAIDGDMQMNLSKSFGLDIEPVRNLHNAIQSRNKSQEKYESMADIGKDADDNYNPLDYIVKTEYKNIDFIPSHPNMASMELVLSQPLFERELQVKHVIDKIKETNEYDFIVFDTNPSLGMLNFNILVASDELIVPVECTAFGVEGLGNIIEFFGNIKRANKNLNMAGVVLHAVDRREKVTTDAIEIVKTAFGDYLFKTEIGLDTNVKQAQMNSQPVGLYKPNSRAAVQYSNLTKEVLEIVLKR